MSSWTWQAPHAPVVAQVRQHRQCSWVGKGLRQGIHVVGVQRWFVQRG